MGIFTYSDEDALGTVSSVDTASVVVSVSDVEQLRRLQVNRLVLLQSSKAGEHLIGMVQKIVRTVEEARIVGEDESDDVFPTEANVVRIALIGTHIDRLGDESDLFRRTLETVPEIDANCFSIEGDSLTAFMRVIAGVAGEGKKLDLGSYTLDEGAIAYLNGNRFFQRHAIVVGSTGSGKSWTTARLLEQVALLPNASAIVFDLHGEYQPLAGAGIRHFRIAGPSELNSGEGLASGIIYLPYWLLAYESLISMFVDRSDQNAPNQTMLMSRTITESKRQFLVAGDHQDVLDNFTIDSPVPFALDDIFANLEQLNEQMVPGANNRDKQGPYFDKLSRLIARLENRRTDRRLGFLFQGPEHTNSFEWLETLCSTLVGSSLVID